METTSETQDTKKPIHKTEFQTVNPATGEILETYKYQSFYEIEKFIDEAHQDFHAWKMTSFVQRADALRNLAKALADSKELLAEAIHLEMGKKESEAIAEIEKSISACEYYAENGAKFLRPQKVETAFDQSFVSFQPLGVIFSIMPWNFPVWQTLRFAAPAIMAGNVVLLKHSDSTTGAAEIIESCFADIAPGVQLLRVIRADHETCEEVIAHPSIRGVTFTGSSRGGREVAQTAGKNLKKTVLELGGSDAYIVLADADIKKAAVILAKARLVNCGQSCVAGKRFVVVKEVMDEFLKHFISEMEKAELAPLAHKKFQTQLGEQVKKLKADGGEILLGGEIPEGEGAYFPATVIRFKKNPKVLEREELFGPVASVIEAKDERDALAIANSSIYGLGGGLFTSDTKHGLELIEKELEAGFVVLNDYVKSDPKLPFGGVKDSGYGRELALFGLHEFVNVKTVVGGKIR